MPIKPFNFITDSFDSDDKIRAELLTLEDFELILSVILYIFGIIFIKTKAYTIRFIAKDAVDETHISSEYAKYYNLEHSIIDITFQDYLDL